MESRKFAIIMLYGSYCIVFYYTLHVFWTQACLISSTGHFVASKTPVDRKKPRARHSSWPCGCQNAAQSLGDRAHVCQSYHVMSESPRGWVHVNISLQAPSRQPSKPSPSHVPPTPNFRRNESVVVQEQFRKTRRTLSPVYSHSSIYTLPKDTNITGARLRVRVLGRQR